MGGIKTGFNTRRKALKIFLLLLLIPVTAVLVWLSLIVSSFFLDWRLDLSPSSRGQVAGILVICALAVSLEGSLLFFQARRWKTLLVLLAAVFFATVGYNAFFPRTTSYDFVGSSMEQVERLNASPHPPAFLFTSGQETRPSHLLAARREVRLSVEREPGEALWFGAAAPEPTGDPTWIEVEEMISAQSSIPLYRSPVLQGRGWNDFIIPASALSPSARKFQFRVRTEDSSPNEPWTVISEPRALTSLAGPNVILIVIDTLRDDYLSPNSAPFFSQLMNNSIVFEQAMAPSSWTVPATASILTGVYPHQHGMLSSIHIKFNPGVEPLAGQFHQAGYQCAGFTANHLISPRYGFARGFDDFVVSEHEQNSFWNSGRILTRQAEDWLKRHGDSSFFLYLHYMDPHYPYLAPPPLTFVQLPPGPFEPLKSLYAFFQYDLQDITNNWAKFHPAYIPGIEARYKGEIHYWDRQFKDLIKSLRLSGQLRNTVVVVTADHGEAFGEHGNFRHGHTLFQEEIHVPLIIFDGRTQRALRVAEPVSTTEVSTLLTGLVGVQPGETWAGRNLDDLLGSDPGGHDRRLASFLSYGHLKVLQGQSDSVKVALGARQGSMKVILEYDYLTGKITHHLYYLDVDPHERNNLWEQSQKEQLPLYRWMIDFLPDPRSVIENQPREGYQMKANELKALGYIQ